MSDSLQFTTASDFGAFVANDDENPSLNSWANSSNSGWIGPSKEQARLIADHISKVKQVVAICIEFGADATKIWTLLKTYDRAAREKVYEKELEICQRFALFGLEFKVTSAELVSPEDLVKDGLVQIFKR